VIPLEGRRSNHYFLKRKGRGRKGEKLLQAHGPGGMHFGGTKGNLHSGDGRRKGEPTAELLAAAGGGTRFGEGEKERKRLTIAPERENGDASLIPETSFLGKKPHLPAGGKSRLVPVLPQREGRGREWIAAQSIACEIPLLKKIKRGKEIPLHSLPKEKKRKGAVVGGVDPVVRRSEKKTLVLDCGTLGKRAINPRGKS